MTRLGQRMESYGFVVTLVVVSANGDTKIPAPHPRGLSLCCGVFRCALQPCNPGRLAGVLIWAQTTAPRAAINRTKNKEVQRPRENPSPDPHRLPPTKRELRLETRKPKRTSSAMPSAAGRLALRVKSPPIFPLPSSMSFPVDSVSRVLFSLFPSFFVPASGSNSSEQRTMHERVHGENNVVFSSTHGVQR